MYMECVTNRGRQAILGIYHIYTEILYLLLSGATINNRSRMVISRCEVWELKSKYDLIQKLVTLVGLAQKHKVVNHAPLHRKCTVPNNRALCIGGCHAVTFAMIKLPLGCHQE